MLVKTKLEIKTTNQYAGELNISIIIDYFQYLIRIFLFLNKNILVVKASKDNSFHSHLSDKEF